ncbi:hypothetical protein D3C86_1924480 [compost metagenome]
MFTLKNDVIFIEPVKFTLADGNGFQMNVIRQPVEFCNLNPLSVSVMQIKAHQLIICRKRKQPASITGKANYSSQLLNGSSCLPIPFLLPVF